MHKTTGPKTPYNTRPVRYTPLTFADYIMRLVCIGTLAFGGYVIADLVAQTVIEVTTHND